MHKHLLQNPVLKDVDHIKIQYEIAGLPMREPAKGQEVVEIGPVKIQPRENYFTNDKNSSKSGWLFV
jgi:hypothetical protein